ncbi:hypothetical protein MNBD_ALPHA04-1562 [hydrothermal vent metagenome]|uniref:Flp pilus assembly protein, pilin Flp n=1 Tax=hydrothermal vent metagenome TaxID=652676 RepID=A0A3B0SBL8_9ZZZZ
MIDLLKKLYSSEKGATAVEYGLIASLIVIASMGALISFSDTTIGMWNSVSNAVSNNS